MDIFERVSTVVNNCLEQSSGNVNDIYKKLKDRNLPVLLAPGLTVKQHLEEKVEEGVLIINWVTGEFRKVAREPNPLLKMPEMAE